MYREQIVNKMKQLNKELGELQYKLDETKVVGDVPRGESFSTGYGNYIKFRGTPCYGGGYKTEEVFEKIKQILKEDEHIFVHNKDHGYITLMSENEEI